MTQITLPVSSLSYEELKAILCNELRKTEEGYLCTVRGLARMLGISVSTLIDTRKQMNNVPRGVLRRVAECSPDVLPDSLKAIAGFDYKASTILGAANSNTYLLPEVVVSGVIKYYAYDAKKTIERAKQLDSMFAAVGVRSLFDKIIEMPIDTVASSKYDAELVPLIDIPGEETGLDKLVFLLRRLESLRLKREDIMSVLDGIGLLTSSVQRNTSYRGVAQHHKKWRAQIAINGTTRVIGSFDTPEEAAKAYDNQARIVYGQKAKLNF